MSKGTRWTNEEYAAYLQRHNKARADAGTAKACAIGAVERAILQEQEACDSKEGGQVSDLDNWIEDQEVVGGCGARYRLSVTFLVSDRRRRDNPGMLETICDVLVAAGRRMAGLGDRFSKNKAGAKGSGGRCD